MASLLHHPLASFHDVFRKLTWKLFLIWMLTSMLNIMFGYDTTAFSGIQSIPAFAREFGSPAPKNTYALSASRASFMSSVAFAGKLLGCFATPFPVERAGHKFTIWTACVISFVGVIVEATSSSVAQFVVGRCIVYFSVGVIEIAVPMYQAELVPASMRGSVVGSLQLFNQIGQIMAAGVNLSFSKSKLNKGWIVPVSVQALMPLIVFVGLFFIPPAPRWLITKLRKEDAIRTLEIVRPRKDRIAGLCREEADAIEVALENKIEKAPWIDLFKGTNLRRTLIVLVVLALQQFTGQGFVTQYSPRFYQTVGLADKAFDYNIASATAGWAGCLLGMVISDIVGRRDLLIWGALGQALFLFLVSGLGTKHNPSASDDRGLVASVVLFIFIFAGTWPPVSYTLGSEIGTASLREKTMAAGIAINVVSAFVVAFALPYLLSAIGVNIGWLFGGISLFAAAYSYLFVPETKYRSLEEMDELFATRLPARKFKFAKTSGIGQRVAELENENISELSDIGNEKVKGAVSENERVEAK